MEKFLFVNAIKSLFNFDEVLKQQLKITVKGTL